MADSKTQGTANINELLTRNPNFREGNVAYQVYEVEGTTRVLAIYDLKRFTAFMEKAQLNQYAASMPLLRHRKPELSWVERHETRSISGLSRGSKLSGAAVSGHPTR